MLITTLTAISAITLTAPTAITPAITATTDIILRYLTAIVTTTTAIILTITNIKLQPMIMPLITTKHEDYNFYHFYYSFTTTTTAACTSPLSTRPGNNNKLSNSLPTQRLNDAQKNGDKDQFHKWLHAINFKKSLAVPPFVLFYLCRERGRGGEGR